MSKYTLPEQKTTRFTFFGAGFAGSPITHWNPPAARSSSGEVAFLAPSRLLGVITMSGFLIGRTIWRRIMWKNCAGVDGTHDLDVVLGAQLQVALEARRRVLRALPLVAVRQEHREAAQAPPLRLARGDELVDHHLGAVGEVAELRLPDDQLEGLRGRVAVLEAEHGLLGQQRVDHEEVGLALA